MMHEAKEASEKKRDMSREILRLRNRKPKILQTRRGPGPDRRRYRVYLAGLEGHVSAIPDGLGFELTVGGFDDPPLDLYEFDAADRAEARKKVQAALEGRDPEPVAT